MSALLLALLSACSVPVLTEQCPDGCDRDGDGWIDAADGGWDCDDQDPLRHPGMSEICNLRDDDCDGAIDDADPSLDRSTASTWFLDEDGDGWGALGSARRYCTRPDSVVPRGGDCADDDRERSPATPEVCNGLDDDCDGLVDDADPDTLNTVAWYLDYDGDGLGDPDSSIWLCTPLPGYVANASDCDDDDRLVGGPIAWRPDEDGDGYGQGPATDPSCEAPPAHTRADAPLDCHDRDPLRHPQAPEICGDDIDQDCDAEDCHPILGRGSVALGVPIHGAETLDWLGSSFAFSDADGDGQDDLWVGGAFHGAGLGAAWLIDGPIAGPTSREAARATVLGDQALGQLGTLLLDAGDVNGDGRDELLTFDSLGVHLLPGHASGPSDALAFWPHEPDSFTATLTAGLDVTGDGLPDLVGTRQDADGCRTVWLETLDFTETHGFLEDDEPLVLGHSMELDHGDALHMADITGDGLADLLVGMPQSEDGGTQAGGIQLLLGPVEETVPALVRGAANDLVGTALATGDSDGDGHADLVVGAPGTTGPGAVYWQPGPVASVRDLPETATRLRGEAPGDRAGHAVALADLDGDGHDDLVTTAPHADGGGFERGVLYVLYGPAPFPSSLAEADAILTGLTDNDRLGEALSAGADLSGDGLADLVVGAKWADPAGEASGAAWVLFGSTL